MDPYCKACGKRLGERGYCADRGCRERERRRSPNWLPENKEALLFELRDFLTLSPGLVSLATSFGVAWQQQKVRDIERALRHWPYDHCPTFWEAYEDVLELRGYCEPSAKPAPFNAPRCVNEAPSFLQSPTDGYLRLVDLAAFDQVPVYLRLERSEVEAVVERPDVAWEDLVAETASVFECHSGKDLEQYAAIFGLHRKPLEDDWCLRQRVSAEYARLRGAEK